MKIRAFKLRRALAAFAAVAILGTATYAVAGLSAASNEKKAEKTAVEAKRQQPALYWYEINAAGELQSQLNSVPQTKDESMPDGSNPLTECQDQTNIDCLRGYATPQTVGDPAPSVPGNDYRIRFSN